MLTSARMFTGYARGMRRFLSTTIDAEEASRRVRARLGARREAFLAVLERGVYRQPQSPYRRLLEWAGVELGDVAALIDERDIEGALAALFDAGVHIRLDEMKGQRPIVREGLELHPTPHDFDNPLASPDWRGSTGGSTGLPTRINESFDLLELDTPYYRLCLEAFGASEFQPTGLWLMAPPGVASFQQLFRTLKVGGALDRWWTPTALRWRGSDARYTAFTAATVALARGAGRRVAGPRHLPPGSAAVAAAWLATSSRARTPAIFSCTPSTAARICTAAAEHGRELAGTLFLVGGEPYTAAVARNVTDAGARAAAGYYMSEIGQIGIACADPEAVDDVHLASDVLAVIQRPRETASGHRVDALFKTTLSPSTPKLMLNVESGDFGSLSRRDCGCPATDAGLTLHLHTIRSHEKLTVEGTNFLASELLRLIEEILPLAFGGHPHDYQFVEDPAGPDRRLTLLVSHRLGTISDAEVERAVTGHLSSYGAGHRSMVETLRRAGAIRVRRGEPFVTAAGKTPALRTGALKEDPDQVQELSSAPGRI